MSTQHTPTIAHSILAPPPVQSFAQYLSHLHQLLEGFELEEFAFCDQFLRITLLQKIEKGMVSLENVEGIQTDPPKPQLAPTIGIENDFNTIT